MSGGRVKGRYAIALRVRLPGKVYLERTSANPVPTRQEVMTEARQMKKVLRMASRPAPERMAAKSHCRSASRSRRRVG